MKCPKCQTVNSRASQYCKKCATPFPLDEGQISFTNTLDTNIDELTRGTLFAGCYEISKELGAGGTGRVYRAYDKKIEEEVALNLIRSEIAAEKRTVERFRNKGKTARKITLKNVYRKHDLGEEGKTLFITMEYVPGVGGRSAGYPRIYRKNRTSLSRRKYIPALRRRRPFDIGRAQLREKIQADDK